MRIAVLSDTHDRFPPGLPARLRGADEIWHLGDVSAPETLAEFETLGPPLRVVLGNCDTHPAWPVALDLEREGVRFHLTHVPPRRWPAKCQVALHGHTHLPRDETLDGIRWLNPGAVTHPRGGWPASFGWLTAEAGRLTSWKIVSL
jgi:putative phosphoesterase